MAAHQTSLAEVRRALAARDPKLVELVYKILTDEVEPETPLPDSAYTFPKFIAELQSREFRRKTLEEQKSFRTQRIAELESSAASFPLPDRYRVGELLVELWQASDSFSRSCLLEIISKTPLVYGPWKALKRIFKEAEAKNDMEVYGALAARFDMALADGKHSVSQRTLGYLCRRAWRTLRKVGESLPGCYADVASDYLCRYDDQHTNNGFLKSWIFNHIFFHTTGSYDGGRFHFGRYLRGKGYIQRSTSWMKYRAYVEAWQRSPRPLFALLQDARSESVRQFATIALKTDFRAALRDVEPSWVARLTAVGSGSIDEFVVWILSNVPKFEQAKFRELGLHDAVLRLFQSPSEKAAQFAADYARTHARDLSVAQLIRLVESHHKPVSSLAFDLLKALDARKEVGLEAWGQLLEIERSSSFASEVLRKHFGASELTADWLAERVLCNSRPARLFAIDLLPKLHPIKKLGAEYLMRLQAGINPMARNHGDAAVFVCDKLELLDVGQLDADSLQKLLIHPFTRNRVVNWMSRGIAKPQQMQAAFLKQIAFHPTYDRTPIVLAMNQGAFKDQFPFHADLSTQVLQWLGDVRMFSPTELGFEWLMELVQRSEPRYHDFAVQTMSKAFLPADFAAAGGEAASATKSAGKASEQAADKPAVDLQGASFVFTGKLATMTRDEAQNKVTAAGGANSNTVAKNLDFLVIGDEGSPLYDQGRKGSKQLKAESLIQAGSAMKVISETAFLQMLAGEKREFSEDAVQAGCERLWQMMVGAAKIDDPLAKFARIYIRHHHPEICLKETDRPVDPGAEMPPTFLTFDRVKPLFNDTREPPRKLALELARYEFARWQPPMDGLVEMCEASDSSVRDFVAEALTCEDLPDNKRFRLDPSVLTADAVYSFCESQDEATRALGMKLIDLHPRLRLPEELFRLTESPDGRVRAFVIRTFWSLYHDRGTTATWKPQYVASKSTVGTKKKPLTEQEIAAKIGSGQPTRPESPPADIAALQSLLRRVLFELPPGRPPLQEKAAGQVVAKLRPLPARKAKLNWVETIRDLAIEDAGFAKVVSPVLSEFMLSRGKSEQAACLVAVTRIRVAHGNEVVGAAASNKNGDELR